MGLLEGLGRRGIASDHLADAIVGLIREASRGDQPGSVSRVDRETLRLEWLPRIQKAHETGAIARLGPKAVALHILSTERPMESA